MKKVLILGGGIYQVPLIKKARELGCIVHVASVPGPYPGLALANRVHLTDTTDEEAILSICREEGIDGICTSGTDVAVRAIGRCVSELGLSGVPYGAACLATDKAAMKRAFLTHNVSSAGFFAVSSLGSALSAAASFHFNCVLKPIDSSGSRGVCHITGSAQVRPAYLEAARVSRSRQFLVEAFIDAHEIGVDGYVGENGELLAFLPHEKFVLRTEEGVTIPSGHAFPLPLAPALSKNLRTEMEKAVRALKLSDCPFNADVFISGDQVYIIEVGARTGATCIPELISLATGEDWYEKILLGSLGMPLRFSSCGIKALSPCSGHLLFADRDGVIGSIDRDKIRRLTKQGAEISLDFAEGHPVKKPANGTDRIGSVILRSTDPGEIRSVIRELKSAVEIEPA